MDVAAAVRGSVAGGAEPIDSRLGTCSSMGGPAECSDLASSQMGHSSWSAVSSAGLSEAVN